MEKNKKNQKNKKWFDFKNETDTSIDYYIYSDIVADEIEGWWYDSDVYPKAVKDFLDSAKGKNLNVFVNSNGGSVFSGLSIYNMLMRHIQAGNTVTVHVDGLAASIASVIAMAGVKSGGLFIPENAFLMIHNAWVQTAGNKNDLRSMADTLDKIDSSILSIYEGALKDDVSIETIQQMMEEETWLSGQEASQYLNVICEAPIEAVAFASDIHHANMPKELMAKVPSEPKANWDEKKKALEEKIKAKEEKELETQLNTLALEIDLL